MQQRCFHAQKTPLQPPLPQTCAPASRASGGSARPRPRAPPQRGRAARRRPWTTGRGAAAAPAGAACAYLVRVSAARRRRCARPAVAGAGQPRFCWLLLGLPQTSEVRAGRAHASPQPAAPDVADVQGGLQVLVAYSWPQDQRLLATLTRFAGDVAGAYCGSEGEYVQWGPGGEEGGRRGGRAAEGSRRVRAGRRARGFGAARRARAMPPRPRAACLHGGLPPPHTHTRAPFQLRALPPAPASPQKAPRKTSRLPWTP